MSDILSQDEVDALLKGVDAGAIETEAGERKIDGVHTYDFATQERIIRGRMPGLEIVNERFTRFFRQSLSTLIMRFVDISVNNMQIVKFGEFMKSIPFPSNINVFKMNPLKGYALAVMEAPLVFGLVEFFFGGRSTPYVKSEGRSFTSIENMVIKKITNVILTNIGEAWSIIFQASPEYVWSEMNPAFVTIASQSEIVVKLEINVEVEDFAGKLFLAYPYSMIEPVKDKLNSGIQSEKFDIDQRWVAKLTDTLLDSKVQVSAELGRVQLTFGKVLDMAVGSIITLDKFTDDQLDVRVQGVRKYQGKPGQCRGNQAIKITRAFEPKPKEESL
ncbi:MAG: flagellar motor switch protein FliM [Nitrospiraceae bacterium]|nr:flagellar motor switch protein FliM [Nitrospiraceae bacterium]